MFHKSLGLQTVQYMEYYDQTPTMFLISLMAVLNGTAKFDSECKYFCKVKATKLDSSLSKFKAHKKV